MSAVLGYFNLRGLGQSIRLLLEYTNETYTEKSYDVPDSYAEARKNQSGAEWFSVKNTLGLKFPNLPYLFIDGKKLTQSNAILKYLGRKHGLMPKTPCDTVELEMLEGFIHDMAMESGRLIGHTGSTAEHYKILMTTTLPRYYNLLNQHMADKKFAIGDYITYLDFSMFAYLEDRTLMDSNILSDYPHLTDYVKRMQAIPQIAAFNKSKRGLELVELTKSTFARLLPKS